MLAMLLVVVLLKTGFVLVLSTLAALLPTLVVWFACNDSDPVDANLTALCPDLCLLTVYTTAIDRQILCLFSLGNNTCTADCLYL